jgi:phospholipid-binding lipoprotein MlaA
MYQLSRRFILHEWVKCIDFKAKEVRGMLAAWKLGVLGFLLCLSGCATVKDASPDDPLEPFNRGVYRFNEGVDGLVIKPAAQVYKAVMPSPARTGIHNVFSNIEDSWSFVNALLQGNGDAAGRNMGRVLLNTFLGLGGVLDFATQAGIEAQDEDLGQTLAVWGVSKGPYLVLPILGPSTVRDGTGKLTWTMLNPVSQMPSNAAYASTALRLFDARANLLDTDSLLDDASDKYAFVRSAYLQRRDYLIRNGEAKPAEDIESEDMTENNASAVSEDGKNK